MDVYRITLAKWADQLTASGRAARWNSADRMVLYTAASRALVCLENVVHRSGRGLQMDFRTIHLFVPETLQMTCLELNELPPDWADFEQYSFCQQLGDQWYDAAQTPVLRVPSAIIPNEYNYLFNTHHPDFRQVQIRAIEPFQFDPRIKSV